MVLEHQKKSASKIMLVDFFWRRVRDSNPGCFVSTQHFECCTFDHSDNSPDITNVLEFVLELRKFETRRIAENRVK